MPDHLQDPYIPGGSSGIRSVDGFPKDDNIHGGLDATGTSRNCTHKTWENVVLSLDRPRDVNMRFIGSHKAVILMKRASKIIIGLSLVLANNGFVSPSGSGASFHAILRLLSTICFRQQHGLTKLETTSSTDIVLSCKRAQIVHY
jgi:hypothetical protein